MQQRPGSFVYFDDEQRCQGLLLTQLAIMEHTRSTLKKEV
jgi:hypothetical protein